jgi:hypothetical protein
VLRDPDFIQALGQQPGYDTSATGQ